MVVGAFRWLIQLYCVHREQRAMDAGALLASPCHFFICEIVTPTLNVVLPSSSFNLLGNPLEDILKVRLLGNSKSHQLTIRAKCH